MILIILLVAAVLRLISINQSLWLDEAINVNVANGLGFKDLVINYSLGDFHPPLYHVLLKSWILLFGASEISVRLPSVILGVGTVFITYLIAKILFEKKTALISATLMATAPLHIYYSQESRMYMLAAFFASASCYFLISILKKTSLLLWFGFIVSTTLMLYSDYIPHILVLVMVIYLFINRRKISRSTRASFIPAFIVILILFSPWLLILPKQIQTGLSTAAASPAWAQVVGSPDTKSLILTFTKTVIGRISHDNNLVYLVILTPVAIFVIFLLLFSLFRTSRLRSFLYFWFFGPIFLSFLVAFFIPIFSYFRFIFVLPAFYILLSSSINTFNWTPFTRSLLVFFLIINLGSTTIYFANPKFQRENWRAATKYVQENSTPTSVILFESATTIAPFDYYNKNGLVAYGALDSYSLNPQKVEEIVKNRTNAKDKVFLFQYLSGITDPNGLAFSELTSLGFVNAKTVDFDGVGFIYEFKR